VRISPLLVLTVVVVASPACSDEMSGLMCTESFAYAQVMVRTGSGTPVQGLSISDTVLRTSAGFSVPQGLSSVPGMYVILDDNFRGQIRTSGDVVRVTGHASGAVFSADYTFDVPDGCHVRMVSGPNPVVVP